jgi:arabinan endo-1,5-alpha-L-arabinosidase
MRTALLGFALLIAQSASACAPRSTPLDVSGAPYALAAADATALCAVHDPAAAIDGSTLFIFSTDTDAPRPPPHLTVRASEDGGRTFSTRGAVFAEMPPWAAAVVPAATAIWAPDVSFFSGRWHLYYALSSFGNNTSAVGLVTTPSLTSPSWTDEGAVLVSRAGDDFNAIDPNLFDDRDAGGAVWLLFGSFWSGLFMRRVDPATGLLDARNATRVHLAARAAPDALEGAFMTVWGGAYYLFASFNFCCRGNASTYEVRVGRAARAEGPFVDRAGVTLLAGGGTRVAGGGHGWAAAGGQSVVRGAARAALVLHAYDGASGAPWLNLVGLAWDADGWPFIEAL